MATRPDVPEVVHHAVPDTAAGAGAAPIAGPAYGDAGMTWPRMLRRIAVAEVAGMATLLGAGMAYGLDFFPPIAIAVVLFAAAVLWLPRMSKASAVYSLVVTSLVLVTFGGLFFGWTGFLYPQSWFEMSFATLTVLLPIAGITAAIATLRRRIGADAARTPARVTAALASLVVGIGIVGSLVASDATRLPGDITLTALNLEFEQASLSADSGNVAIYFENKDPFAHNIQIKGVGTSKDANGRQSIRHVFEDLSPGTYPLICAIHPDMKGTLKVS